MTSADGMSFFFLSALAAWRPDTQAIIDTFTEPDCEWLNEQVGTEREAD